MHILVGMLAKQVMRHAALSPEAGKRKYQQLFADTNEYAAVKPDVDSILIKCGYRLIISNQPEGWSS